MAALNSGGDTINAAALATASTQADPQLALPDPSYYHQRLVFGGNSLQKLEFLPFSNFPIQDMLKVDDLFGVFLEQIFD